MMKSIYVKILLLAVLALVLACNKEVDTPAPVPEIHTLHYKVPVQAGTDTRVALDDNMKYVFEEGDRVYVESVDGNGVADGNMYGFLSMSVVAGVGKHQALFEGDLTCKEGFQPDDDTDVKLVLVAPRDNLHVISGGKVTGTNYENKWSGSMNEAVRQLSHFTGTGKFGDTGFTLSQKSSFLVVSLSFNPEEVSSETDVTAELYNRYTESSKELLHRVSCKTTDVDGDIEASYVAVFPAETEPIALTDARLEVKMGSEDPVVLKMAEATLQANNYYSFQRATYLMDYFTVEAMEDETTWVAFNYALSSNGIQYSLDGYAWQNYSSSIKLSPEGDKVVYFRGKASKFNNTGSTPLLSTGNKACYVYGDIMFLMCDEKYKPRTAVPDEYAFQGAFKNCTWLHLKEDHKLKLSATTLKKGCYKAMFMGCTGLTELPSDFLPAMEVEEEAYYQMFNNCSALTTPPTTLPATTLKGKCYYQMFQNCAALTSAPSFPGKKGTLEGIQQCYQMFNECTSLTTASGQLFTADTQLTAECFHGLFRHCTALNTVPKKFLPSMHMASMCYRGMFEGAVFTIGPDLPATELVDQCYRYMFYNCKNLKAIRCNAANPNNGAHTQNWVGNVQSLKNYYFYMNSVTTDNKGAVETKWPRGVNGIPNNWKVDTYTE